MTLFPLQIVCNTYIWGPRFIIYELRRTLINQQVGLGWWGGGGGKSEQVVSQVFSYVEIIGRQVNIVVGRKVGAQVGSWVGGQVSKKKEVQGAR